MPRRGDPDQRPMGAPPVVSVIVPVKDTPPHLLVRAVASVADQDCDARVELVLWDDGSRDPECTDAIDRVALRLPELVVAYRSRHNRGISAARNAACAQARGAWFVWLDSDDELPPSAIRLLLAAAGGHARFAIGQCEVVHPNGRTEVHRNYEFLSAWQWSSRTKWDRCCGRSSRCTVGSCDVTCSGTSAASIPTSRPRS